MVLLKLKLMLAISEGNKHVWDEVYANDSSICSYFIFDGEMRQWKTLR